MFDEHLNGHTASGLWTQTKSSRVEIFLATAFKIMFCFSAGVSICQVSWYFLRRQPAMLGDIDVLVGEPSLMTLPRRHLILEMPLVIFMTAAILASPLITILTPSLNTRQASSSSRTLTVPTLNTTTDAILNDVYLAYGIVPTHSFILADAVWSVRIKSYGTVTETWDKTALVSLLSDAPVGWSMPDGCSPECEYHITYAAPALRCSDLQPNQIDDGVQDIYRFVPRTFESPPSAYLLAYDALSVGAGYASSPLNFTVQNDATAVVGWNGRMVPRRPWILRCRCAKGSYSGGLRQAG
ncbi:hypothetical protein C8R44DRAFT_354667 [Mycena epipterygia]|nr:hypothetical protein C8R44DRAFT_354667 [Mycena epipterygia]